MNQLLDKHDIVMVLCLEKRMLRTLINVKGGFLCCTFSFSCTESNMQGPYENNGNTLIKCRKLSYLRAVYILLKCGQKIGQY